MRPLLALTIDVEEDMPGWRIAAPLAARNVTALPRLAELCARLGVQPTYLCTHPVVTLPEPAAILRALAAEGGCELGTHLHPWTTPPYGEVPGRAGDERLHAYYLSELPAERFRAKLEVLHTAVGALAGTEPRSFRAGRFGLGPAALRELVALGYTVDTSVTPLAEHTADGGPDFRAAPERPYRPSGDDVCAHGELPIVEIPVSIGLTRRLPRALRRAYVHLPRALRLRGLLSRDHLGWVDFAWLYPVRFGLSEMQAVARNLVAERTPILNVFLHSSELYPGVSGRVDTAADVEGVFARLEGLLAFCRTELGAEPVTLSVAARALEPDLEPARP
ncbi:MAG TPA: hypothetical protein VF530_16815 [Planctomycetota bacterium]